MARSYSLKTETEMALAKAAQTETETKEKIARIEIDKLKEEVRSKRRGGVRG